MWKLVYYFTGIKNVESIGEEDAHESIITEDAETNKNVARHAQGASLLVFL